MRKLFKFQIYSWAPGWIELAPAYTFHNYTTTKRTRLPAPYSSSGCTNQPFLPYSTTDPYNHDMCVDVCIQEQFIQQCGCLDYTLQFTSDQLERTNHTVCYNVSMLDHIHDTNANVYNQFYNLICNILMYFYEDRDKCDQLCPQPCEDTIYDISTMHAPWPHISHELAFYQTWIKNHPIYGDYFNAYDFFNDTQTDAFDKLSNLNLIRKNFLQINVILHSNSMLQLTDTELIGWETMMSNVGGTISFWFGMTFLSLLEFVEFLYNLLLICWSKRIKTRGCAVSASQIEINQRPSIG